MEWVDQTRTCSDPPATRRSHHDHEQPRESRFDPGLELLSLLAQQEVRCLGAVATVDRLIRASMLAPTPFDRASQNGNGIR